MTIGKSSHNFIEKSSTPMVYVILEDINDKKGISKQARSNCILLHRDFQN